MPRRILLLITDLEIGGTPTVVRELATRLNAPPAVEVEVACLKGWGPVADQLRAAGVRVTALGASRPWHLPAAVRAVRHLVRERGTDTVFSFLIHANTVAALAARRLPGVRFLQSIQTVQPRPRWHWRLQRVVRRYAEAVVVPSTAVARVATGRSGVPPGKVVVIPNAIDPAEFRQTDVFKDLERVRAGYLGRLDPAKSPGELIPAFGFARMDGAELHYFGDGPARARLEREAARSGFGARVVFHGAVARPQDALSRIDVLWHPSRVEGFGLVLIEAMASGVPVVAPETGGAADVVREFENAVPAATFEDFGVSLYLLRDDPDLRRKVIGNGLRTVREKFTWDVVLPQYRRLLGLPAAGV